MYGYEYEDELLQCLRLMKCLHQQNPAALEKALRLWESFDEETIPSIAEYVIWEICQDAVSGPEPMMDEDGDLYGDDYQVHTVEFTHPAINRFGRLSCKWSSLKGYPIGAWHGKFFNAVGYFLGKCDSFCNIECFAHGASGRIKVWFSPDCYDFLEFGNAIVDLICWLQRESARLEEMLKEAEYEEAA